MKHIYSICLVALICNQAFCQHYMDNWYFGDNAALNFSTGVPVYQSSPMTGFEAYATISDSLGNLLFFSNGISLWDKFGNKMPHGDSLEIAQQQDAPYYGSSVTQGVIILPLPGSSGKYYVFYIAKGNDPGDINNLQSLMYSVVDMSLNGGNGDVADGQKNIPVAGCDNYIWEKMTAVKHGNGKDWWLICISGRLVELDPCYLEKFLITQDGISAPQFQPYDTVHVAWDAMETSFSELGQMKFSLSGKKIAITRGSYIDVYDFNRCDGMLSNRLTIDSVNLQNYGLEFSNDETKLYATSGLQTPVKPELNQICLDCNIPIITKLYSHATSYNFAQLQVAPDGKIYTGFAEAGFLGTDARFLSVINYPDSFGVSCDFELASFELGDSGRIRGGLPNFVNYDLGALTGADSCGAIININDLNNSSQVKIFPNPADNYIFLSDKNNNFVACEAVLFYNSTGVLVKKIVQPTGALDVSDLAQGIYVVAVTLITEERYIMKLEILK